MDLNNLNETMPYKWRVQSFSKRKAQGQCVAYVDARDVQKKLDSVCGKENWQALYYEVGKMLFCKIGIKIENEWVWKSDTGSESNIEKEKGHSSDAFKRAGVLWGIGRFLYDMKIQYVDASEKKTNSNYPHVVDNNGKRVWDLTKHINNLGDNAYKRQGAFMDEMKKIAISNPEEYKKYLKSWGLTSAKDITNTDSQENVLKELKEIITNKEA